MKTLTNEDCSEWLASRKLRPDPYYSPEARPPYCEQFPLSDKTLNVFALFRSIVECIQPFDTALLHVTDWSPYHPDEMALIVHVRQAFGERRPLIETPGHVFTATEHDLLIGLLSLVTSYGWTAYIYFDHGITFLSWEGDLLDFYSPDSEHHKTVCELLQHWSISPNATGSA